MACYAAFLIKKNSIRFIVISNDHNASNRAIARLLEHKGTKSIFIQHATTGIDSPPLEFDICFLNGSQSLEQYKKNKLLERNINLSVKKNYTDREYILLVIRAV